MCLLYVYCVFNVCLLYVHFLCLLNIYCMCVCVCVWVSFTDHILQAVSASGDLALLTLWLLQVASNPSFFY